MIMNRRDLGGAAICLAVGSANVGRSTAQPPMIQASAALSDGAPWPPPETLPLWPGGPPDDTHRPDFAPSLGGPPDARELRLRGVSDPALHVFRPERPNGAAILSIPGGGYDFVSIENAGVNVARRFTPLGYTVFALSYRLPREGWAARQDVLLQDAQRAIRLVRAGASGFGIRSDRVIVLGFSAGGHLAGMLGFAHARPTYARVDASDLLSARPDRLGLIYALLSLEEGYGPDHVSERLFGAGATAAQHSDWSPLAHVDASTPPSFLVHSADDSLVMPNNSVDWRDRLQAAGVASELHVFERGEHGYGPTIGADHPAHLWPDLFDAWLRRGFQA